MGVISQNQYDYLKNLINQGGGNGEWAKSQLQGATVEQPKPVVTAPVKQTPTATTPGTGIGGGDSRGGLMQPGYATANGPEPTSPWATSNTPYNQQPLTNFGLQNPGGVGYSPGLQQLGGYMDASKANILTTYANNQDSGIAKLKAALETAKSGFGGQETQAKQLAQRNRDAADISNAQAAQRLRESMANAGILASGDNQSAMIQLQNQRQGAFNDINTNESNTLNQISDNRNALINAEAQQETGLIADINAQRAQAMQNLSTQGYNAETALQADDYQKFKDAFDMAYKNKLVDVDVGKMLGSYNGQDTLDAFTKKFDMQDKADQTAIQKSQQTGYYMPPQAQSIMLRILALKQAAGKTMSNEDAKMQADLLRAQLAGMGVDPGIVGYDADLSQAATNVANYQGTPTLGLKETNSKLDAQYMKNLLDGADTAGYIPDALAERLGLPKGMKTAQFTNVLGNLSIGNRNADTSAMNARTNAGELGLNQDKFSYSQDPNNVDNRLKESEITKNNKTPLQKPDNSGNDAAYSEFLGDLPRIASRDEGTALVEAYRQDGVSEKTLQNMLKAINSKFKK